MLKILENISGDLVLSKDVYGFESVIKSFKNASYINIVTYNITSFEDAKLIKEIREVDENKPINIILNIPSRFKGKELSDAQKKNATTQTHYYLKTLERNKFGDLNVFFNFKNHAKLIMTDKIAYIGSQNFSDASSDNVELGFVVSDPYSISQINYNIFEKIKKESFRYATSDYTVKMEIIAKIMNELIEDMRYNIFTMAGDEPYVPEIEVFDIDRAYFPTDKWEEFKELNQNLSSIIEELKDTYSEIFNETKADKMVNDLNNQLDNFVSKLDDFAVFLNVEEDSMMWEKFRELDTGEDLNKDLEMAVGYTNEFKQEQFSYLGYESSELIEAFDNIIQTIESISDLIEEIKFEMIKVTVYENENLLDIEG